VLSCPSSISVTDLPSNGPGEIVFYSVTAIDDLDPSPLMECLPPSGSLFPPGTTLVMCAAEDSSANLATCEFPVTVEAVLGSELCFHVNEFEAEEDELELEAAFAAGSGFDPRREDLTILITDDHGARLTFSVFGTSFRPDGDDEFKAKVKQRGLKIEVEIDLDDGEMEVKVESKAIEGLRGPMVTIELMLSLSGSVSETFLAHRDDDELEFEARHEASCDHRLVPTPGVRSPRFDIDPEHPLPGEPVEYEVRGGEPGSLVQIFLVGVDGRSMPPSRAMQGVFDQEGHFTLRSTAPPIGLAGLELSFRAVTTSAKGAVLTSDCEVLKLGLASRGSR